MEHCKIMCSDTEVRSECLSAHSEQAMVAQAGSSVCDRGKKGGGSKGGGGPRALPGTREYEQSD